jgi:hypothetical protein
MIADVNKVIEWLENNNLEHWTVSTSKGDNTKVFETEEGEPLEARKSRFRRVMDLSTGGRFIIKAKHNKTDSRGLFEDEFSNNPTGVAGLTKNDLPTVITGVPEDKVKEMIQAERANWERDLELKSLRERTKELEADLKEKDSALNRVIGKLEPFIGTIAGALMNKIMPTTQVALGTTNASIINNDSNTTETMDQEETTTRVEAAIEKWATADPENFVRLIEFIADFAATGKTISPFPGMNLGYKQISEMLK